MISKIVIKIFIITIILLLYFITIIYGKATNLFIICSTLIWVHLSIVAEKYVWSFFFEEWLRDRLASIVIMTMVGISTGLCMYKWFGNKLIILPVMILELKYIFAFIKFYRSYKTSAKENITVIILSLFFAIVTTIWFTVV